MIDLRTALKSASTQCGNVIYNCEQRPADNERHLSSWRLVKEFIDAALISASAQPEYLSGCRQTSLCEHHGQCMCVNNTCPHTGKTIRPRMCVEPQEAGIVYPSFAERKLYPLISET